MTCALALVFALTAQSATSASDWFGVVSSTDLVLQRQTQSLATWSSELKSFSSSLEPFAGKYDATSGAPASEADAGFFPYPGLIDPVSPNQPGASTNTQIANSAYVQYSRFCVDALVPSFTDIVDTPSVGAYVSDFAASQVIENWVPQASSNWQGQKWECRALSTETVTGQASLADALKELRKIASTYKLIQIHKNGNVWDGAYCITDSTRCVRTASCGSVQPELALADAVSPLQLVHLYSDIGASNRGNDAHMNQNADSQFNRLNMLCPFARVQLQAGSTSGHVLTQDRGFTTPYQYSVQVRNSNSRNVQVHGCDVQEALSATVGQSHDSVPGHSHLYEDDAIYAARPDAKEVTAVHNVNLDIGTHFAIDLATGAPVQPYRTASGDGSSVSAFDPKQGWHYAFYQDGADQVNVYGAPTVADHVSYAGGHVSIMNLRGETALQGEILPGSVDFQAMVDAVSDSSKPLNHANGNVAVRSLAQLDTYDYTYTNGLTYTVDRYLVEFRTKSGLQLGNCHFTSAGAGQEYNDYTYPVGFNFNTGKHICSKDGSRSAEYGMICSYRRATSGGSDSAAVGCESYHVHYRRDSAAGDQDPVPFLGQQGNSAGLQIPRASKKVPSSVFLYEVSTTSGKFELLDDATHPISVVVPVVAKQRTTVDIHGHSAGSTAEYAQVYTADYILIERGTVGEHMPKEDKCPNNPALACSHYGLRHNYTEISQVGHPCGFIPGINGAQGNALHRCGVRPKKICWSGLTSMMFGVETDGASSGFKQSLLGYPGQSTQNSQDQYSPTGWLTTYTAADNWSGNYKAAVTVADTLAIDMTRVDVIAGAIDEHNTLALTYDFNSFSHIAMLEQQRAYKFSLSATYSRSAQAWYGESVVVNLSPDVQVTSATILGSRSMYHHNPKSTFSGETACRQADTLLGIEAPPCENEADHIKYYSDRFLKMRIRTRQGASSSKPSIPVLKEAKIRATTGSSTSCEFRAYKTVGGHHADQGVIALDDETSASRVQATMISAQSTVGNHDAVRDEVQHHYLPDGKVIAQKIKAQDGSLHWETTAVVNFMLTSSTTACVEAFQSGSTSFTNAEFLVLDYAIYTPVDGQTDVEIDHGTDQVSGMRLQWLSGIDGSNSLPKACSAFAEIQNSALPATAGASTSSGWMGDISITKTCGLLTHKTVERFGCPQTLGASGHCTHIPVGPYTWNSLSTETSSSELATTTISEALSIQSKIGSEVWGVRMHNTSCASATLSDLEQYTLLSDIADSGKEGKWLDQHGTVGQRHQQDLGKAISATGNNVYTPGSGMNLWDEQWALTGTDGKRPRDTCLEAIKIDDKTAAPAEANGGGGFHTVTAEVTAFTAGLTGWTTELEVGHVGMCLKRRDASHNLQNGALTSAPKSTNVVDPVEDVSDIASGNDWSDAGKCATRSSFCESDEIEILLSKGTQRGRDFLRNQACYEVNVPSSAAGTANGPHSQYDLSSIAEECFIKADISKQRVDRQALHGSNGVVATDSHCLESSIRALEWNHGGKDSSQNTLQHARVKCETIKSDSNAMLVCQVTVDTRAIARVAAKARIVVGAYAATVTKSANPSIRRSVAKEVVSSKELVLPGRHLLQNSITSGDAGAVNTGSPSESYGDCPSDCTNPSLLTGCCAQSQATTVQVSSGSTDDKDYEQLRILVIVLAVLCGLILIGMIMITYRNSSSQSTKTKSIKRDSGAGEIELGAVGVL